MHFESLCCACKQRIILVSSQYHALDKHKRDMKLYCVVSNVNCLKMWLGFQSTTSAVIAVPYLFLFDIHLRDLAAEL